MAKVGMILDGDVDIEVSASAIRDELQRVATREGVGNLIGDVLSDKMTDVTTGQTAWRISCRTDREKS